MRVWLVTIGEPLPFDDGNERLLRAGILGEMLSRQGHEVVWWNSTFNHYLKTLRAKTDTSVQVAPNYRVWMLHGGGYRRNISLQRIRDHRRLAKRFAALAPREPRPDVIVCSYPPLELSLAAVEYGRSTGVPVILDVRDLWPDTFAAAIPRGLGLVGRIAIRSLDRIARRACTGAFAIWGSAPSFMSWGVRHAGREPTSWDRYFPFGYVTTPPSPEEIAAARAQWAALGVGADRDEFIACYIGNVGQRHDVASIVDTAERLIDERGIKLVICGAGDRLEELRARGARLPNLVFSGWRRRTDVWTLLRIASVGIAPYDPSPDYIGSISNKVPEYLSANLPVATNLATGLLYDLLRDRDCGFSYGGDPARLAAELTKLRDDPQRLRQLRANATAVFEEQFRADRVYGDMIATLQEMVNATRERGTLASYATST